MTFEELYLLSLQWNKETFHMQAHLDGRFTVKAGLFSYQAICMTDTWRKQWSYLMKIFREWSWKIKFWTSLVNIFNQTKSLLPASKIGELLGPALMLYWVFCFPDIPLRIPSILYFVFTYLWNRPYPTYWAIYFRFLFEE